MSRNPYAGLSTTDDPYTSQNGYGAPAVASSTDDYTSYGANRYVNVPPAAASESNGRAVRQGGYGGFGEPVRSSARDRISQASYNGSRITEEDTDAMQQYGDPVLESPPRRAAVRDGGGMNGRPIRQRPNGDSGAGRPNGLGLDNEAMDVYVPPPRARNNRNGNGYGGVANQMSGGGDGTRQIQGECMMTLLWRRHSSSSSARSWP